MFDTLLPVVELPIPELVEKRRRSIAMLTPGASALNREEAVVLLEQLAVALKEVRKLKDSSSPSQKPSSDPPN
jgi:hypothetical protein